MLMARQQFVAHSFRIYSACPLVAVRECANSLIAEEPGYLRDRQVDVTQILRGEVRTELSQNFAEAQPFRGQPPRQCPGTHAKRMRNIAELRLAVRQKRGDGIFDRDAQRTFSGAPML